MADEIQVRAPRLTSRNISPMCFSNDVNEACAKKLRAELEMLESAQDLRVDGGFVSDSIDSTGLRIKLLLWGNMITISKLSYLFFRL